MGYGDSKWEAMPRSIPWDLMCHLPGVGRVDARGSVMFDVRLSDEGPQFAVSRTLLRKTSDCSNDSMKSNQTCPICLAEACGRRAESTAKRAWNLGKASDFTSCASRTCPIWLSTRLGCYARGAAPVLSNSNLWCYLDWMLEHCQPWPCLPARFENLSKCWQSLWPKWWEARTLNPKLCHIKKGRWWRFGPSINARNPTTQLPNTKLIVLWNFNQQVWGEFSSQVDMPKLLGVKSSQFMSHSQSLQPLHLHLLLVKFERWWGYIWHEALRARTSATSSSASWQNSKGAGNIWHEALHARTSAASTSTFTSTSAPCEDCDSLQASKWFLKHLFNISSSLILSMPDWLFANKVYRNQKPTLCLH